MSRTGPPIQWTRERIIEALKERSDESGYVGWRGLPGGLRGAVAREFGSDSEGWKKACKAAGVKPRPRGRPKGSTAK